MANPNATAATLAIAIVTGLQWLGSTYGHVTLHGWWKEALTGAVTVSVLYIGKDGIKGAISRLWSGTKTVWSGKKTPAGVPDNQSPLSTV